jgi:hypothetical protein
MKPLDEERFCYLRNELNIIDSRIKAWASCNHTYISRFIWFRFGHGNRGSVVLIDWANHPLIMPIVRVIHLISFCDMWASMTSISYGPNKHLCGLMPNTHTWWPRPPTSSSEELVLCEYFLDYIIYLLCLWKTHPSWSFLLICMLASMGV